MKYQLNLTLEEITILAVERLIQLDKLKDVEINADWHFDIWNAKSSYVIISQED